MEKKTTAFPAPGPQVLSRERGGGMLRALELLKVMLGQGLPMQVGGVWTLIGETRYLYDGMQIVQERDGSNVPTVSYTRGKDLSGSLEGAGGIGGMLARSHGYSAGSWSTHSYYHADGMGNITRLVNSTNGVVASYKYDAYGRTTSSSGSLAGANVYRFSSKMWIYDGTPGYYYFGYRFYEPSLQRWLNRDPIGELGGVNLFAFVRNSPSMSYDPLGEIIAGGDPFGGKLAPTQASSSDANETQGGTVLTGNNIPAYPVPPRSTSQKACPKEGLSEMTGESKQTCPCTNVEVRCLDYRVCERRQTWLTSNSGGVMSLVWVQHRKCAKCLEGNYGGY